MGTTEHRKLIYQLEKIYNKGNPAPEGFIYYKYPMLDISNSYNIWAKRAHKKGYLDLLHEDSDKWIYIINKKGLELLGHLQPNNIVVKNKSEVRKERRKQRRLQRRQMNDNC